MKQTEQHVILALAISAVRNLAAADMALNPQQRGVINATVGMFERMGKYYGVDDMDYPVKLAVYHGKAYVVPVYTNWLATDEDGTLYAYMERPEWDADCEVWEPTHGTLSAADSDRNFWCITCDREDVVAETSLIEVTE